MDGVDRVLWSSPLTVSDSLTNNSQMLMRKGYRVAVKRELKNPVRVITNGDRGAEGEGEEDYRMEHLRILLGFFTGFPTTPPLCSRTGSIPSSVSSRMAVRIDEDSLILTTV